MEPIWVIGAGGHAKVVIDTARATGAFRIVGILDDNACRWGEEILGIRVHGAASPASIDRWKVRNAVVAIGHNRIREQLVQRLDTLCHWATIVHPRAHVAPSALVGPGTVVFAGVVVQADATVGRHVVLNTGCTVDHDNVVMDFTQVAPGAHLGGNVTVETGAFIGIGASVIPGRTIGQWAMIGAGAVVAADVPAHVLAKGVPARFRS